VENNRFFENRVELNKSDRQTDNVSDCRNKDRCTFFNKPHGESIGIRLLVKVCEWPFMNSH